MPRAHTKGEDHGVFVGSNQPATGWVARDAPKLLSAVVEELKERKSGGDPPRPKRRVVGASHAHVLVLERGNSRHPTRVPLQDADESAVAPRRESR